MKLQLKRSNVLVSGSAKAPEAGQLDFGELAINYSADDPVIFLKDSNNQVIRISGIGIPDLSDSAGQSGTLDDRYLMLSGGTMTGNITLFADPVAAMEAATKQYVDTTVGNIDIPSATEVGTVPPSSPVDGALWWDTNDGRLYVYYTDVNSSQWVPATPETVIVNATVINSDNVEYYLTGISGAFDGTDDEFNYSTSLSYNPSTDTVTSPKFNGAIVNPGAYTTSARDGLSGLNAGDMIFNSSDSKLQIWNGTEWEAAGGASVSAPQISNAVLSEQNTGGDRFTSETFNVALTMLDDGAPVSQKGVKGKVTAQFEQFPSTTASTLVNITDTSTSASPGSFISASGSNDLSNTYGSATVFTLLDPNTGIPFTVLFKGTQSGNDTWFRSTNDLETFQSWFYSSYSFDTRDWDVIYVTRNGKHVNGVSKSGYNSGSFNVQSIFSNSSGKGKYVYGYTNLYKYSFSTNGNPPNIRREPVGGGTSVAKNLSSIATTNQCRGFIVEPNESTIHVFGKSSTNDSTWFREFNDATEPAVWDTSGIGPDRTIVGLRWQDLHGCVVHNGSTYVSAGQQLRRFDPPVNNDGASLSVPVTPSYYYSGSTLEVDEKNRLIIGVVEYLSGNSGSQRKKYYTTNNKGVTWTPVYFDDTNLSSDFQAGIYSFGYRAAFDKNDVNDYYMQGKRYDLGYQDLTVTDGADLAELNVGDVVKITGVTDPNLYSKIRAITDNGNGTHIIRIGGGPDAVVGDTIEAIAPTGTATSTRYLVIDATGTVTTHQASDPGFTQLGPGLTQQITFPATFPTGNTPDAELAAGTTLQVEVEATNSVASDTYPSNIITPA